MVFGKGAATRMERSHVSRLRRWIGRDGSYRPLRFIVSQTVLYFTPFLSPHNLRFLRGPDRDAFAHGSARLPRHRMAS